VYTEEEFLNFFSIFDKSSL